MTRRLARRALAVLAVAPALALVGTAPAAADAPIASGWWNLAHQGLQPPSPPDVGPTDLLLQGGPQPSAVTALRFVVAPGARVGRLVLPLAPGSSAPPRLAQTALCLATTPWEAAANGPWAAAPAWSCERSSAAALSDDGTSLIVTDPGRLLGDDGVLTVVLVPGASDRVVLAAPPTTALEVAPPPGAPAPGPVVPTPGPVTTPAPFQPQPAPFAPAAPVGAAPFVPAGPAPVPAQVAPVPTPFVAPQDQVPPAPQAATPAAARVPLPDDNRTRLLVGLEALLVLATFGLLGAGPLRRLSVLTGQPVLAADRPRGVGRFAQQRTGAAPRL